MRYSTLVRLLIIPTFNSKGSITLTFGLKYLIRHKFLGETSIRHIICNAGVSDRSLAR